MLWMQKQGVPAVVGALIIVVAMVLTLAAVATIVGTSIAEFTSVLPSYQERLDLIVEKTFRFIAMRIDKDFSGETLGDLVDAGWAMGLAATILNGVRDVLTNAFLILFTMVSSLQWYSFCWRRRRFQPKSVRRSAWVRTHSNVRVCFSTTSVAISASRRLSAS
jgi:predicted PurR-regulated permease PerM